MKLNKLTAALLCFCMLLTCVPAMAAEVALPSWSTEVIPEGTEFNGVPRIAQFLADVTVATSNDALRLGTPKEWYFTLMGVTETQYQTYASNTFRDVINPMAGIYAKGYITYEGTKIYFKDVPIVGVGKNGANTRVYPVIKKLDIVNNQCTSDYATKLTAEDEGYVDTTLGHGSSSTASFSMSTDGGAPEADTKITGLYGMAVESGATIDTGHFPTGTMFMAAQKFTDNAGGLKPAVNWGNYYLFNPQAGDTVSNPEALALSTGTGQYEVWALVSKHNNGSNDTRKVSVTINGQMGVYDTLPEDTSAGVAWAKLKDYVIDLQEGQLIYASVNCKYTTYGRFGGLAIVPVGASDSRLPEVYFDTKSGEADADGINYIKADDLFTLQSLTTGAVDLTADTVSATVNGTAVNASKWHDASETTDIFGDVIDGPSVYDALVAAGLAVKADGTNAKSVFVNGKQIYNTEKVALNEGDVIVVNSGDSLNVNNFSAVKASLVRETEGSSNGLKYCLNLNKLANVGLSFVKKYTADDEAANSANKANHNNFVGAHLAGYWFNTTDFVITNTDLQGGSPWQFGDVESVTVPEGTRCYMMNKEFASSAADATANRISVNIPSATFGNDNAAVFMVDAVNNIAAFKEANGFQYIRTGGTENNFVNSGFNKDNLFVTNANADGSIEVVRKGAKFGITTNGVAHLALVRVKANGTKAVEEVTATVLTPVVGTLEEGETIYVWGYNQINGMGTTINATSGISMVPMCEPIK